jgi:hypothetical protein
VPKRGQDDSSVNATAAAPPALDSAIPASGFSAVRLGEDLLVLGDRLDAGPSTAKVRHPFMPQAQSLAVTVVNAKRLRVSIPAARTLGIVATWPAGIYTLSLKVARPGQPVWTTNSVPFILAPSITVAPSMLQPPAKSFELTLTARPQVHEGQSVVVLFDDIQILAKKPDHPATVDAPSMVKADVPGNIVGLHRVRLRVDGIDSIPVKTTGDAIDFDRDQSVEVQP